MCEIPIGDINGVIMERHMISRFSHGFELKMVIFAFFKMEKQL